MASSASERKSCVARQTAAGSTPLRTTTPSSSKTSRARAGPSLAATANCPIDAVGTASPCGRRARVPTLCLGGLGTAARLARLVARTNDAGYRVDAVPIEVAEVDQQPARAGDDAFRHHARHRDEHGGAARHFGEAEDGPIHQRVAVPALVLVGEEGNAADFLRQPGGGDRGAHDAKAGSLRTRGRGPPRARPRTGGGSRGTACRRQPPARPTRIFSFRRPRARRSRSIPSGSPGR